MISIRAASADDLERVTAIYNQAITERVATCDEQVKSLDERRQWFAQFDDRHPIFVATTLTKSSLKTFHRQSLCTKLVV